jgi:hypothetical protein
MFGGNMNSSQPRHDLPNLLFRRFLIPLMTISLVGVAAGIATEIAILLKMRLPHDIWLWLFVCLLLVGVPSTLVVTLPKIPVRVFPSANFPRMRLVMLFFIANFVICLGFQIMSPDSTFTSALAGAAFFCIMFFQDFAQLWPIYVSPSRPESNKIKAEPSAGGNAAPPGASA